MLGFQGSSAGNFVDLVTVHDVHDGNDDNENSYNDDDDVDNDNNENKLTCRWTNSVTHAFPLDINSSATCLRINLYNDDAFDYHRF